MRGAWIALTFDLFGTVPSIVLGRRYDDPKVIKDESDDLLYVVRHYDDRESMSEFLRSRSLTQVPLIRGFRKFLESSWDRSKFNTLAQFLAKASLDDKRLDDSAVRSWVVANNRRLYYGYNLHDIAELKQELKEVCDVYEEKTVVTPCFSAGANVSGLFPVGKSCGPARKLRGFRHTKSNEILSYYFNSPEQFYLGFERNVCKLITVPKSLTKRRTITPEVISNAYYQNGISRIIDSVMSDKRLQSWRFDRSDQTRSRRLALFGSKNRQYACMDLSSASDDVTHRLVDWVFSGTLREHLLCARSPQVAVTLDGKRLLYEQASFAGMGNATTFPVEMLIFISICRMAIRRTLAKSPMSYWLRFGTTDFERLLEKHVLYLVYGDDILVHRIIEDEVERLLKAFNFHLNRDKSFRSDRPFKEACGIEAYDGVEITPLRISRQFDPVLYNSKDVGLFLPQVVSLSNACYRRGYWNLRRYVLSRFHHHVGVTILDDTNTDDMLIVRPAWLDECEIRWNEALQRFEQLCDVNVSIYQFVDQVDRYFAYGAWLLMKENAKEEVEYAERLRYDAYAGSKVTKQFLPLDLY